MKIARLSVVLIMLYLASCAPEYNHTNKTVFKYNEASGISSLDPAYAANLANIWACNQLFNGLIELDSHLQVKPAIAKSWEISDDGKKYRFYLRQDVYFHPHPIFKDRSERKVTASDFVFSFKRIIDPATASPGAWVFHHVKKINGIAQFLAPNDTVFEIILNQAFPPFLGILSMKYCSVIPMEIVTHYGKDFRHQPIGTGPFYFKMWKEGVKMVLLKNPDYYQFEETARLPYLDAVAITFLKDKQSAFLEFVKGNLDFMSGIDPNYKDELLTKQGKLNPKYANRFYLVTEPYLNTEYLGILVDTSFNDEPGDPLVNLALRKALNFGFDRKKMIRYLRNGIGIPGNYGIIPVGMPSFNPTKMISYSYRPDSARYYLSKSGYLEKENPAVITLTTTHEYLDLCEYIQHQWSELGIAIEIDVNTPAAIKEMKAQAKLDFFRASWVADYPDAENYLALFYSKNFAPAGPNYTHFSNKSYDALFEKAQHTFNDQERYTLYTQMNRMIMDDSPVIILYYDQVLRFIQNNITGLGSNPINLLDIRRVKKLK